MLIKQPNAAAIELMEMCTVRVASRQYPSLRVANDLSCFLAGNSHWQASSHHEPWSLRYPPWRFQGASPPKRRDRWAKGLTKPHKGGSKPSNRTHLLAVGRRVGRSAEEAGHPGGRPLGGTTAGLPAAGHHAAGRLADCHGRLAARRPWQAGPGSCCGCDCAALACCGPRCGSVTGCAAAGCRARRRAPGSCCGWETDACGCRPRAPPRHAACQS